MQILFILKIALKMNVNREIKIVRRVPKLQS